MLLLKTDLGIFSKEVLTVTAVSNVNYDFVKCLFAASDISVVSSAVRTGLDPTAERRSGIITPCL